MRWSRRWAALTGAGMLAAVALLAGPVSAKDREVLPAGTYTAEQRAAALDLVEITEKDLPQFADRTKLAALGFFNFGVTAPGGYDHWINKAWLDDGRVLDPNYPESLVFRSLGNNQWKLEAAMFFLPTGTGMNNIPADMQWWPGWHTHNDELCVNDAGVFTGIQSGGRCVPSGKPFDMPPMMHVWIVDNVCGHRFGGVGIGGLNCDGDHAHGPTGTFGPNGTHIPHGTMVPTGPAVAPVVAPADAVKATPNFTG